MKPCPVDIAYLYGSFCDLAESLLNAWESGADASSEHEPRQLVDAMSQLAGILRRVEDGDELPDGGTQDIHTLGEYGLQLLRDLSDIAAELGQEATARELENLCLPMAVWMARRGGEVRTLAPVVNALAHFANHSKEPEQMQELLCLANEVYEAVSPALSEDSDKRDPMRPWRLLLLNRAIVATRTLQPSLMEPVFDSVVENLPEDAARFFAEGMEQMDIIGYPQAVREVMTRYYQAFGTPRILH